MRPNVSIHHNDALRATKTLSEFYLDCLRREERDLAQLPASERFEVMSSQVTRELLMPRLVTTDVAAAQAFYEDALERGHEGVMVKALDAPYVPGSRSALWLKVKRSHTLDLVVLAAEWGHGRRRGWLSNLHLGPGPTRSILGARMNTISSGEPASFSGMN